MKNKSSKKGLWKKNRKIHRKFVKNNQKVGILTIGNRKKQKETCKKNQEI